MNLTGGLYILKYIYIYIYFLKQILTSFFFNDHIFIMLTISDTKFKQKRKSRRIQEITY